MSEPQTSTRSGDWLTVSQAAALIGVSEKTLRKRIANGDIKAEKVKLSAGGWAWRVEASRLEAVGSRDGSFQPRDGTSNERETGSNRLEVPTASNRATEAPGSATEAVTVEVPTAPSDAMAVALVSQLQSENVFLRSQIEAANRQAAEATAALREYLKMQAKALPSGDARDQMERNGTRNGDQLEQVGLEKMGQIGTETAAKLGQVGTGASTRNDAENSRENAPQSPINAATGKQSQETKKAVKREMRPLWKVILGVR